jgi:hypothetical protein
VCYVTHSHTSCPYRCVSDVNDDVKSAAAHDAVITNGKGSIATQGNGVHSVNGPEADAGNIVDDKQSVHNGHTNGISQDAENATPETYCRHPPKAKEAATISKTTEKDVTTMPESPEAEPTSEHIERRSECREVVEVYDGVMVCTGHHTVPYVPNVPGMPEFQGKVIHSQEYKVPVPFAGQTVLVVGK